MTSDHVRRAHTRGYDADCPACRESCHCGDSVPREVSERCVGCRLKALGVKP